MQYSKVATACNRPAYKTFARYSLYKNEKLSNFSFKLDDVSQS